MPKPDHNPSFLEGFFGKKQKPEKKKKLRPGEALKRNAEIYKHIDEMRGK